MKSVCLHAMGIREKWQLLIPILFADFLIMSLPKSVLPGLLVNFFGEEDVYYYQGLTEMFRGIFAFIFTPMLGAFSDTHGRKGLLIFSIILTAAPSCALAFTSNMGVYLLLRVLAAGFQTFPLAFAYISDLVEPERRSQAFGLANGFGLGLAFLIGPMLGAIIAEYSSKTLFQLCVAISFSTIIFSGLLLEKNTSKEIEFEISRLNPFSSFRLLRKSEALRKISLITFFYYISLWGVVTNKLVYLHQHFNFTHIEAGYVLTLFGFINTLMQTYGLKVLGKFFSEIEIASVALLSASFSFVILAFATEAWMVYVQTFFLAFGALTFTLMSSLASQAVPEHIQGEAQGIISGIQCFTEGIGPPVLSFILPMYSQSDMPGLPFLLPALATIAAWLILHNSSVMELIAQDKESKLHIVPYTISSPEEIS